MTMTAPTISRPVQSAFDRPTAMRLAATEYQRLLDLLRSLSPAGWAAPTECSLWDVRAMAAHALGMVEMSASLREQSRQQKAAKARLEQHGGLFIDALTGLQVDERADMTPQQIIDRFAARAPKAAKGRRRTPGFIRRRPMPVPQRVNDQDESWTIGFLVDTILTRDPWMHRIDIVRATGADHVLTPEHDGLLVADVVTEWASRHGQAFSMHLTGPAGGTWSQGSGGPELELDAIDFCRTVALRAPGTGPLATEVPF